MSYKLHNLADIIDIEKWSLLFNDCPLDKYVPEGFRYKQLSWFTFDSRHNLQMLPHAPLMQSNDYNPIHGNIIRYYPPINDKLLPRKDFLDFLNIFKEACNLTPGEVLLVQLQRIDCNIQRVGHPAIEGFHQDGINWLGLMVVTRNNISGAETLLKNATGEVKFQQILQPGELLIIDDKAMLHYTTPITPAMNDFYGYRDVVIVTACAKDQYKII